MYPLISEYIVSIKSAEDNLKELSYLRPVLGDDGEPVMTSGNFAVVFKMEDERKGKSYALKCFTKEQKGRAEAYRQIAEELKNVSSPYLTSVRYLDKELFVDTEQTDETEFPVLLMDWVEGKTLDKYLRENLDDKYALEMLAYRFSQLAQWLIPQPFAHGDLKPDNILVRDDGTLVLVDYDGMYVPAMKGQKARELGSPDFRHPLRMENDFDEHIDDFPFISILLSLKAISQNPQSLEKYGANDRLLFGLKNYLDVSSCKFLNDFFPSSDKELNVLVGTMMIVLCFPQWEICDKVFDIKNPSNSLSTEASIDEIKNGILDKDGYVYSRDGRKLLGSHHFEVPNTYVVKEGTQVICNNAFVSAPQSLILPSSIIAIGKNAFGNVYPTVSEVLVPKGSSSRFKRMIPQFSHLVYEISLSITYTDAEIEEGITDESNVVYSKDHIKLIRCNNSQSIHEYYVQKGTKIICSGAFGAKIVGCEFDYLDNFNILYKSVLSNIILPDSILRIGSNAFFECRYLRGIVIPNACKYIGEGAFSFSGLEEIMIPSSVQFIGDHAFLGCTNLHRIVFKGFPHIGHDPLFDTIGLRKIIIPKEGYDYFKKVFPRHKDILIEDS